MHTFSPVSTQYEIESWIFPHPGVRRLQNARNPDTGRQSLHAVTPLTRSTKEREGRARLRKGHQRWHSNEYQILHNGLHRNKGDKVRNVRPQPSELRVPRAVSYPIAGSPMGGHHIGVSLTADSPTGGYSTAGFPLKVSPTGGFPVGGDSLGRGDVKSSQDGKCHSQAQANPMLGAEACIEEEVGGLCLGAEDARSRNGRAQSRLCESLGGVPLQMVSNSRGRSGDNGVRPSEFLSIVSSSHHPHKQLWVPKQTSLLPSTGHGLHPTQIQLLQRPPSYSHRQSAISLKSRPEELEGLLRSFSCRSRTMTAESGRLGGDGESQIHDPELVVAHNRPNSHITCPSSSLVQGMVPS